MKIFFAIILLLVFEVNLFGQDGSDILYWKTSAVDSTLVGRYVHFDFYRRSFRGRQVDTVVINIDKRSIQFVEIRKDTGYNNWFNEQYLQSVDTIDGCTIRVSRCRLENVSQEFVAILYLDYYDKVNSKVAGKSRQLQYSFDKRIVNEVLIESK